jgi:hypothetical protein
MTFLRSALTVIATSTIVVACGASTTNPTPAPTPGVLQIAGQYQILQQAATDTCGQTGQPQPVTATATHGAGANTFTMRDTGGTSFSGTVQNSGEFTASAVSGPDSGGQTFTQQLQGRFGVSGFTATLSVHVTPQNCDFTRNWTATKQGSPNVFPG